MKPLMLHGHERAITKIKYNREGDLLFSSAKDKQPNVWYSLNGERLGTFIGHEGAVWCIDVNWDTTKFISGAGDSTLLLWDCKTGKAIGKICTKSTVRTCQFSYSGNMACYSTVSQGGHPCELFVIDVRCDTLEGNSILRKTFEDPKITALLWGCIDDTIITGHDNGELQQFDIRNGKTICTTRDHTASINDMQMNKDSTFFITASKDYTAKLFDSESLLCLKTYKTERPVNSAAISPILDHVVLGGGQDAMEVTTTSARIGKFDSRFFHLVFEEEFARVKGHFGPINSVAFHPDGRSYSSGGEDGYVRVHYFDNSYFEFKFDY
ncbi:UNVERIFIED_CONTAM: hypothetical protein PYX00_001364 [Menopon gallinae]|uniref:Eukaryotic translation initiation factor 3 subunit I n=1 Tax=Menopon gallinae TaxID=328185 RepID=A0AAW2ICJ8_9NEOP